MSGLEARKLVAIHQPNFFPWLGYFNKIARSDIFIVLDNVQFSKTGGTWSNRVRILLEGRPIWATLPVERSFHGVRLVREMRVAGGPWRVRLLRTIRSAYRRASYFGEVFPLVEELIETPTDMVAEFNLMAVRALINRLGLHHGSVILGSTLGVDGAGTDLLVNAVRAVGGNGYLCGGGAQGYQEDDRFASAGIGLVQQIFHHPVYPQVGTNGFVPGLSIIDTLMNCGFVWTRELVIGADTQTEKHSETGSVRRCR